MGRVIPGEVITYSTRAESHEQVDKQKRYKQILSIFNSRPEMTAKECAVEMCRRGYIPNTERNFTAPRLTELSKMGKVEPVGKTKCEYTGKTVTEYGVRA